MNVGDKVHWVSPWSKRIIRGKNGKRILREHLVATVTAIYGVIGRYVDLHIESNGGFDVKHVAHSHPNSERFYTDKQGRVHRRHAAYHPNTWHNPKFCCVPSNTDGYYYEH